LIEMLDYILSNPERILTGITTVVSVASVITAATETPKPETALGKLYKILELLALVIGKAKK
jgi:hypothetical protein